VSNSGIICSEDLLLSDGKTFAWHADVEKYNPQVKNN
jgi:hypothetical protein